jgi:adenylate kinase
VIELKVDEDALVERIATRVRETEAAGGQVRADDNPESFKKRLVEFREKTAPLSAYYAGTGELRTVDGMKPIDEVSKDIDAILAA